MRFEASLVLQGGERAYLLFTILHATPGAALALLRPSILDGVTFPSQASVVMLRTVMLEFGERGAAA
jgi:hypothetical protein